MKTLYLSVAILLFTSPLQAAENPSCEGSWLYSQYKVCENFDKPIPALGSDPAYCDEVDAKLVDDFRCPPIYPTCADLRHGVGAPKPYQVIPFSSDWVGGGLTQALGCQRALGIWRSNNPDPLLTATLIRPTGESSEKIVGFPRYKYHCELQIYKNEPLTKASPYCGDPIGYKTCTVKIVEPCMHTAFAKEFTKERHSKCDLEAQPAVFKGEYNTLLSRPDVAEVVNCMSCDDLRGSETAASYVKCIYENYVNYQFNSQLMSEGDQALLLDRIREIVGNDEYNQHLLPMELALFAGVLSQVEPQESGLEAGDE